MNLRLFAGITAPETWKKEIGEWRRKAQPRFSDSFARWSSDANLHLTLRFFGSVEEGEVVAIAEALQKVASQTGAFSVRAGGIGCFPNISRPRIVWLGLDGAKEEFVEMEGRVRISTANFGHAPEDREFHPHLTLARVREANRRDREARAELIRSRARSPFALAGSGVFQTFRARALFGSAWTAPKRSLSRWKGVCVSRRRISDMRRRTANFTRI